MPTPTERKSLTTTLDQRYASQRAGSAFDVKKTLGTPGNSPKAGTTIDATSMLGQQFQTPNGFEVKMRPMDTQFLDAQGTTSRELSTYIKGIDTKKYRR